MAQTTRYTELTGCRVPVQQAPMGSVLTAALAVAVADAGGVGSITALGMTAAQLDKILAGMTARTTGILARRRHLRRRAGRAGHPVLVRRRPAARVNQSAAVIVVLGK